MNINIKNSELNELIEKAKNGDTHSFELIIKIFQRYSMVIAFKILCNETDAKDVVQEGFVKIWKHLKNYNPKIKFSTWIYKIIVNLCYDKLRQKRRTTEIFKNIDDESVLLTKFVDPEKELTTRETAELIKYFSEELSEKQKIIFVLRDIEELSIVEVSEITGMPEASVKTNLFYARKNIREKIIGYDNAQ